MKRMILRMLGLFFCGGLLFGCGSTQANSNKDLTPSLAGNVLDNRDGTENPLGEDNLEDGEKTEENTLPEGNMDDKKEGEDSEISGDEESLSEKITVSPEAEKNVIPDMKFEPLENYKERNIPSVYSSEENKEMCCNVLLNTKNQIEYYTYERGEDGCHFWKYTLIENAKEDSNSASWEREALLWCEGFGKEIGEGSDWVKVFTGEDGNDYAWYLGTDGNAHFVKRVKDSAEESQGGDSYVEITGLDWIYSNFVEPAVLENGNIVLADLGRKCSIYSGEGQLLERFQCGFYQGLCTRGNQIYIGDATGASVQHYDAKEKEFAPLIKSNFDTTIRVAVQDDDVYVCNMKGIYRAKMTGGNFQKVLDAGTYHFAKESGTLLKFFVIGDAFYVVYGEDGVSIKKYSPAGEGDVVTNFLTLYSLRNNDVILDMISEYQNMYPNIEIIYETKEGAEGSITTADCIRALNARILAGDGPDILLMDGMPMDSYKKKGILADLNPVLGSLKEELTPNIVSAYTQEDKIYMLPARFSVPFFLSCDDPERYATLDALVEYSEENEGVMLPNFSYSDYFQMLYYNYPPKLVTETGEVNREEITKFLELLKRMCESEGALESAHWPATYLKGLNSSSVFAKGQIDLAFVNLLGGFSLGTYPSAIEMRGGQMVPNGDLFFPNTLFAINNLSSKPKLAASFLQFAFSYDMQERYVGSSGFPIHEKALDELAELDMSNYCLYDGEITLQDAGKEENAKMIEYVRTVRTPFTVDASIWDIVWEAAAGYLNGKSGISESVESIVNRIQIYLYEQ